MCEISGYAEIDADWSEAIDAQETTAEINGRKRKVTVSHEDAKLSPVLFTPVNQNYTLQNRAVTNSPIDPMKFGGSGDITVELEWDHREGLKFKELSGRIRGDDKSGNYAEVEVYKKGSDNVKARVRAGRSEEEED